MRYIKQYGEHLNEKKWYWWVAAGLANYYALSSIYNSYNNYKYNQLTSTEKVMLEFRKARPVTEYDSIIKSAKDEVKAKVLSSSIIDKDSVINAIDNIKIIEAPKVLNFHDAGGYLNVDLDSVNNLEYILVDPEVMRQMSDDYKKLALTHELFHLVDRYKLLETKPEIKPNPLLSLQDYVSISFKILNDDSIRFPNFVKRKYNNYPHLAKYFTANTEVYARLNNLKLFLTKVGKLKSPNDNISPQLWEEIYNGSLIASIKNERLIDEFYASDYFELLPFLKSSNLDEINKLAYISKSDIQKLV